MDGFGTNMGVIILAATNRADIRQKLNKHNFLLFVLSFLKGAYKEVRFNTSI
jgi:hypothetical protein